MRFGCCTTIENGPLAAQAGYDFIELNVCRDLQPETPDEEWAPIRASLEVLPLPVVAFNVLLPGDLKVTGPHVDPGRIRRYLYTAFERAGALGGEVIVFGSGGARTVPEGFPRETAWQQLVQFVRWAGDAAQAVGMQVAIEPLNRGESNVINSVLEAVELAKAADHPAVRVLADLYHLVLEGEPIQDLIAADEWLVHVHVADAERRFPGSGSFPYPAFFGALKAIGYDQRISVECHWDDFATEGPRALAFLRQTWAA
ncbi:MAG: sugar phosphate isomerase/epimerase family protein [Anaerolineae bacterium]|nr:sugar phosphate isomerase/epimerase [Anaerolineae bacterium]MDW8098792.1 sugar phosphate isomerase/epimerase family protein [Anaerolineae bacterium]